MRSFGRPESSLRARPRPRSEQSVPTLNWIGKEAVVNHHLQVPFHLLKDVPELACGNPGDSNLIVPGDNLVALKALLPYYAGQVEYKGKDRYTAEDAEEKQAVGAVWASRTGGRCLFAMPTDDDFLAITRAIKA